MAYSDNINPGSPPLLWSNVQEAFTQINDNFDILVTTIGDGSGLVPLVFESLDTDIRPATDNLYRIGDATHTWKSIHLSEYSDIDSINGIWLGSAQITGTGPTVNLPANSTIGGELIKDPSRVFFKEIQVDDNFSVVALEDSNSFGLNSGTAITLSIDSASEAITINNNGVIAATGGTGISVSSAIGNVTFTNTGVTSLTNTTALPSGRTRGSGINVSAATGGVSLTNTGVLSIEAGSAALIVSTDAATGIVTITNAAPAGNTFRFVTVNGLSGSPIEANNVNGVLNFTSGQGITLSQNIVTDTVTFTIDPVFDLTGSIFADDSSIMVDAIDRRFYGDLTGNVVGNVTGNTSGSAATVTTAAQPAITSVGTLTSLAVTGSVTGASFTGNIFTNLIDSADSSAITVTPKTIFSSDVNIENELVVANGITFSNGSSITSYRPVTVYAAPVVNQTITDNASATSITFVDTVDTTNSFVNGVFTVPYTGYYQFNVTVYFTTSVTMTDGFLTVTDTTSGLTILDTLFYGATAGRVINRSTMVPLTAGHTVALFFRQVSGAPVDIGTSSKISIHRVSVGA